MKVITEISLTLFGICILAIISFGADFRGKKVLFIDSYHEGYAWSDQVVSSVRGRLKDSAIELRIFRMDTKRHQSEDFKQQAALEAKAFIESYQPDVVIACDDNASKYLIQPYYQDTDLPIVFCGVNWDAGVYGYPYANATGMVEVELLEPLVAQLRQLAKGDRIGFLSIRGTSSEKDNVYHANILGKPYDKTYFVRTYKEWKACFLQLQDEVDYMIIGNPQGLSDWDEIDFVHFAAKYTRKPSGATIDWVQKFTLMGYMRDPQEQGSWAAGAALKILKGTPVSDIPMAKNRRGKLIINMRLARRMGVTFDPAVFKRADIINPYPGKKILYINSYHAGEPWSAGIEKGILNGFKNSEVELKIHYMDTKIKRSEAQKKKAALRARQEINAFGPDVVIASDDNASQYLIVPYYKNTDLPFVFCGVNGDSSRYGYPCRNVTGMEAIERVDIGFKLMRPYARGERKGFLAANTLTGKYLVQHATEKLGVTYHKVYLTDTYAEWKDAYLRLQEEVDMFIISSPIGAIGWDQEDFTPFAFQHVEVPTLVYYSPAIPYAMMGFNILSEEHGEWSAATALRIIDGERPGDIPITQNKLGKLMLNLRHVKKLGVVIDQAIYSRAEIFE